MSKELEILEDIVKRLEKLELAVASIQSFQHSHSGYWQIQKPQVPSNPTPYYPQPGPMCSTDTAITGYGSNETTV